MIFKNELNRNELAANLINFTNHVCILKSPQFKEKSSIIPTLTTTTTSSPVRSHIPLFGQVAVVYTHRSNARIYSNVIVCHTEPRPV